VRHWLTGLFLLLGLISLYTVVARRNEILSVPLRREEKIVLAGMALFVLGALLPALAHPFHGSILEVELKYLLFIPVYLTIRQFPEAPVWLVRGFLLAGLASGGAALYQSLVLGVVRATGPYDPNYFAAFCVVALGMVLAGREFLADRWRPAAWLSVAGSVVAVLLSGSRAGYVMVLVVLLVWGGLSLKRRTLLAFVGLLLASGLAAYLLSDTVRSRVDYGINEVTAAVTGDQARAGGHSLSLRIALWKLNISLIRDHFPLGVGRKNIGSYVERYLSPEQRADEDLLSILGHPHNAYVWVLSAKGLVGALGWLLILFYPLWLFSRRLKTGSPAALMGVLFTVAFVVYSLVHIPFARNGESSLFVLTLAVMMSAVQRRVSPSIEVQQPRTL